MWIILAQNAPQPTETPETAVMDAALFGAALFGSLSILILLILAWAGPLSTRAFRHAPPRDLDIGAAEFGVGIFAIFIGIFLTTLVFQIAGLRQYDDQGQLIPWNAEQTAAVTLLSQGLSLLPMVFFLLTWPTIGLANFGKLGFVPRKWWRDIAFAFVGVLVFVPLVMAATYASTAIGLWFDRPMPESGHALLKMMTGEIQPLTLFALIASAVIVAPIVEEIVYRCILQTCLVRAFGGASKPNSDPMFDLTARWLGILFTAIIFALVHLSAVPWQAMPGLFIVGLGLGYLYERTGSLLTSIAAHAFFNALNIAMALALKDLFA